MASLIYTISLNSSIDFSFYLDNIVDEDINRIKKIRVDPGGKGINVSRMLKKLGENSIAITFLGKDNGKFYEKLLKKEKIKIIPILIKGNLRNIYNFISKNRVLRFNEKGPLISKKELDKFWDILLDLDFKKGDFIVMSGSIPPGIKDNIYAEIIKKTRKFKVFPVVDADGNILRESIKEKPFIIKPNLNELERCFETKIEKFDTLKNICISLINSGIQIILITLGKDGAILFTKQNLLYSKPPEIDFKSSIGCGDAFLSGFLYKLKYKKNYEECLKFAVACGTSKAEKEGTKMPSNYRIKQIIKYVKIYENPTRIPLLKS
ncbi:MAG: 1-phosphofructokinase family hexose kinase [Candidatus Omnitrophica bacterium]|nr:1-phosphofructokinase family hexose kinase [Candidatus Omnitrophota bacterium]MCM8801760.1 1-phosphofructokinase family hexose kinase [Candidatus Omnitrophota bacterium]